MSQKYKKLLKGIERWAMFWSLSWVQKPHETFATGLAFKDVVPSSTSVSLCKQSANILSFHFSGFIDALSCFVQKIFLSYFPFPLSADPIQWHGIHIRCSLALSSAQHSFVVTKVFCQRATRRTPLTCSKRISFMTPNTTLETSTFNAVEEQTFTSSGTCGVRRERKASSSTLTPSSKLPSISHRSLRVGKASSWSWSPNAQTFASGTSHQSLEACHATTRVSISNCTKLRRRSKSVWWEKAPWWSPISRWSRSQTSSDLCFKTRRSTIKTWCISSSSLSDTVKSFKARNRNNLNLNYLSVREKRKPQTRKKQRTSMTHKNRFNYLFSVSVTVGRICGGKYELEIQKLASLSLHVTTKNEVQWSLNSFRKQPKCL